MIHVHALVCGCTRKGYGYLYLSMRRGTEKMYYIESSGSWFEIGRDHGSKLKAEIRKSFADFNMAELLAPEHAAALRRMQAYLAELHPELAEEIRGIAAGSGLPFNEVFLLSAAETLRGCLYEGLFKTGCTVMAVRGEDGRGVVGKTHDINPMYQRWGLIQVLRPSAGIPAIRASQVGAVWTVAGINEAGLSTGLASGQHFPGQTGDGLLQHCCATPVLAQCSTVSEAEAMLRGMVLAGTGVNVAFTDASGDIAVIEKSVDRQAVRRNPVGPVFAAQHFWEECMQGYLPPPETRDRNSRGRCDTLARLLSPGTFADPVTTLKEVLSYREGPAPICQNQDGFATLTAFLADGGRRRLYVCSDAPTPDAFICFSL